MQRSSLRAIRLLALALVSAGAAAFFLANSLQQAQASGSYLTAAEKQYPTIVGSAIDSCSLCHTSSIPSLNVYGMAYMNAGHSFTAIENQDSDGDKSTNIVEINAHTFPGDAASKPPPTATPTQTRMPPTATATRTATATATHTPLPPTATATRTPAPPTATNTALPPTATRTAVPPTATATSTRVPATVTATSPAATATNTRPAPSATSTRAPATVTATPSTSPAITYRGVIRQLPGSGYVGDWRVGDKLVHVTAQTRIARGGDDDGRVRVGMIAQVQGSLRPDGSIAARTIIVVRENDRVERSRELHKGLRHDDD